MAFIFGGNTPWTYDELKRQRALADMLASDTSAPKNVGEGLNAIGNALAYRGITRRAGKEEARMKGEFDRKWGEVFSGGGGGMPMSQPGATASASGPAPAFTPPDPNSPGAIAGDTMAALGKQVYTPGDRESFIKAMMPHALRVSEVTGLDPRLVIAQAAQETGWGKSAPGNNFFGIKSHGKAGGNTFATNEVINGKTVRINDSFRGYDSMGDSAMGYAEFLKENPRYREMLAAGDLDAQIEALGRSGYATDPNYAASVRSIATSIGLPEGFTPGQSAPAAGPGMDIGSLVTLASDPMASPQQQAVVNALIEQQLSMADPMRALEMEKAQLELAQMKNPTQDPLAAIELEKAEIELARMKNPEAEIPKTLQERTALADAAGLPEGEVRSNYLLTGELPKPGGGAEFGLTPVLGRDKDGNVVVMQLGKDGTAVKTQMPDGVTADLGLAAEVKAEGAAVGKAKGEDEALLASTASKMDGLEAVVAELDALADKATYTFGGQLYDAVRKQTGLEPREAAVARAEYIAKVDNQILPMLRDTFGAAFTVKEGETLRATLGDPDKSPQEKKAVLRAFIEQKKRDIVGLEQRTGKSATGEASPANDLGLSDDDLKYLEAP